MLKSFVLDAVRSSAASSRRWRARRRSFVTGGRAQNSGAASYWRVEKVRTTVSIWEFTAAYQRAIHCFCLPPLSWLKTKFVHFVAATSWLWQEELFHLKTTISFTKLEFPTSLVQVGFTLPFPFQTCGIYSLRDTCKNVLCCAFVCFSGHLSSDFGFQGRESPMLLSKLSISWWTEVRQEKQRLVERSRVHGVFNPQEKRTDNDSDSWASL